MKEFCSKLPAKHLKALKMILALISRVVSLSDLNKMNARNCASVFAMVLIVCDARKVTPEAFMSYNEWSKSLVVYLIEHIDLIEVFSLILMSFSPSSSRKYHLWKVLRSRPRRCPLLIPLLFRTPFFLSTPLMSLSLVLHLATNDTEGRSPRPIYSLLKRQLPPSSTLVVP